MNLYIFKKRPPVFGDKRKKSLVFMESRAKPVQQQSQVLCYVTIAVFAVLNEPWSSSLKVQEFDNCFFFFCAIELIDI